jgi:hypothetical protein
MIQEQEEFIWSAKWLATVSLNFDHKVAGSHETMFDMLCSPGLEFGQIWGKYQS